MSLDDELIGVYDACRIVFALAQERLWVDMGAFRKLGRVHRHLASQADMLRYLITVKVRR